MSALEPPIIRARANICRVCADPCPERDTLNLADGCTACPRRIWHAVECADDSPPAPMRGLGDVVALVANPIARAMDATLGTKIVGCGGCAKRQAALNKALPFT